MGRDGMVGPSRTDRIVRGWVRRSDLELMESLGRDIVGVSLLRGPSISGECVSWLSGGGTSPAITRISPRANVATLTTTSPFTTSCIDPPARVIGLSLGEPAMPRQKQGGEDRTILLVSLSGHIGRTVEFVGGVWRDT